MGACCDHRYLLKHDQWFLEAEFVVYVLVVIVLVVIAVIVEIIVLL